MKNSNAINNLIIVRGHPEATVIDSNNTFFV